MEIEDFAKLFEGDEEAQQVLKQQSFDAPLTRVADCIKLLKKVYGAKLASYLCQEPNPRNLTRWEKGTGNPGRYQIPFILAAFEVTQILLMRMSTDDAVRWMIQPNQWLDFRYPADEMAVDPEWVRTAATRLLVT